MSNPRNPVVVANLLARAQSGDSAIYRFRYLSISPDPNPEGIEPIVSVVFDDQQGLPNRLPRLKMSYCAHRMVDLVADRVGSRFKQLARLVGRSGPIVRR
ncbi:MAG: hypothetical protein J0H42_25950 [Rhizobiales bacterium]|nr:hypothetical protein [Hyphomicrobiales bacterium]